MLQVLFREIEGTCITSVKFEKVTHEYLAMADIQESVHENSKS